ncbi:MAG: Na(+)-translocating NADH-quinone reductase subunit A [Gammaproteobacteria bacterium]|nr:Na(+)-translocating NADH-quinone reductase subunit A [Gammaproteobacteria bacterium]
MIKIRKGLDLPIAGAPQQSIGEGRAVRSVAVLGGDYPGMKPTMAVGVGDTVAKGQTLFTCKKTLGVNYTAPAAGTVTAINRGAKRALQSVVIELGGEGEVTYQRRDESELSDMSRADVVNQLVDSGAWTAFRTRPFAKVPDPVTSPNSIFVTALDTNPLAADPSVVLQGYEKEFSAGLAILARLTDGPVHVCHAQGKSLPKANDSKINSHEVVGPHPAGLAGTHIHFLDPVSGQKTVWYLNYQEVIAFGHLFLTGTIMNERVVAIGGPGAAQPRLVHTLLGASLDELTAGELIDSNQRVISGSVLAGRTAQGPLAYLGRYDLQVSILPEDAERKLLGYLSPGADRHSVYPSFLSKWLGEKNVKFTTTTNGSTRAMVPIGTYDAVMPMDILATQLMRSLLVGDLETAINLGCLELDEDDIALCTYVCPGKYEFGPVLRRVLEQIEKEG